MSNIANKQLDKLYELSLLLSGNPDDIIYRIAEMIAGLFDVRIVVITEIQEDSIQLLCACIDGMLEANLGVFPLELTPCAMVKKEGQSQFFEQVSGVFPKIDFLKEQKVSFYYGVPAMASNNKVISTACLLDDKHHDLADKDEELLRIFGQRVAMELERKESINKQKKIESELRESQAQLNSLANISPVGLFRTDSIGHCIYVNELWCHFSAMSAEEALGESWVNAVHPEDRGKVACEWKKSVEGEQLYETECRFVGRENKISWMLVRVAVEKNVSAEVIGYIGSATDITLRKEKEIENERYRSKLQDVQHTTRIGFFEYDIAADKTYWSEEVYSILAIDPTDIIPCFRNYLDFIHPDDVASVIESREQLLKGELYDIDYRIINAQGAEVFVHGEARMYVDDQCPDGKITGTIQDISERKYIENAMNMLADFSLLEDIDLFYERIVANLVRIYNARYAFLGLFTDSSMKKIVTKAVWGGSGIIDNFEYELQGTPCNDVLNDKIEIICENAARLYPHDSLLADMGVESYFGAPLIAPSGEKLGLITVMDTSPMELGQFTKSILQLFSQRVASIIAHNHIESRVKDSQKTLSSILENMQDIFYRTDEQGRITMVSPSGEAVLGYSQEEVMGTPLADLYVDSRDRDRFLQAMEDNGGTVENFEAALYHKDGHIVWMSANSHFYYDEQGNVLGVEGVTRDVTNQHMMEMQSRKMFRAMEQTADMVIISDISGIVEYVNPAFEKVTGYCKEEVMGTKANMLNSGRHDRDFYEKMWSTILAGETYKNVLINKKKDGSFFYEDKTITPLKDDYGEITHFVSTGRDISQRMEHEKRLQYIAHHDALTDLPNRILFMDRIHQALAHARRNHNLAAILFIDLDRFKNINDTLGHMVGDKLLVTLSRNLQGAIRDDDTIARLGGDEFAILVDNIVSEHDIAHIAQKVLDCLDQSVDIEGHHLYVTASVGISIFPTDGEDADTLLKHADVAMYRAKDLGKNNYQFYSKDMSARASQRLLLESGLRQAMKNNEFVLHYQPQVDIHSREITGFEALIRWHSPTMGLIAPDDFVPLLEETGLIVDVGDWVIDTACRQLKAWQDAGYNNVVMSVNVSGRQFHSADFYQRVVERVKQYRLPPELLELEITESILMDNQQKTIEIIDQLDAYGFRIAIDDFGTGYSSLSYLRRFRIDTLKIDQSFVRDVIDDPDDAAITSAIIAMAHSLKLDIVAEGVENNQQLEFLMERNCQLVQGYFFSRPLPADEIQGLLLKGLPASAVQ